jgi:hypothetical protein
MYLYFIILIILCFFGYSQKSKVISKKITYTNTIENKIESDKLNYKQREDNLLND